MPAWFMIEPAQMKNGTASSGNESVTCTNFCTKVRSGRPSPKMKNDSAAMAMANAIGTSIANSTNIRSAGRNSMGRAAT